MSENLDKVDFKFEPENRTSIGLVSGEQLTMRRDEVDEKPVYNLLNEAGEVIGSAPSSVVFKLAGKTPIMKVSDDCRTVSVAIVTASKVAGTALDTGLSAWKGCMSLVLLAFLLFIMLGTCSSMIGG